jgi:SAM-dependent methyltransferase
MTEPKELYWTPDLVERYWAFLARRPDIYFSYHRGAAIAAFARRHIAQGASVIDYGCGPGFLLPKLIKRGYRVAGADIVRSPDLPELDNNPNFIGLFSIADLMRSGRRFDAVFLIELVEHLYDDALAITLDDARTLLSRDGVLLVTTPNDERLEDNMIYYPPDDVVFHRWQHVRSWNRNTLSDALEGAGFKIATITETNFLGPRAMRGIMTRFVGGLVAGLRRPESLVAIARKR